MTETTVTVEMTMAAFVQLYTEAYQRGIDAACAADADGAVNGPFDAQPLPPREVLDAAYNMFRLLLANSEGAAQ